METRVRFAPSPTGHLHIGGARTALYCYLYAKATNGKFILRIEDTDEERSKKEFEDELIKEMKWMGIDYDEGPDRPGDVGPYRQSERKEIYREKAQELVDKELAYHCFCSNQELEAKKEQAMKENRPPHYDGTCRNLEPDEVARRLSAGEPAVVRFKSPRKAYVFKDRVRGRIVFPEGMVGDFVIMRSTGTPVYNFCCTIDDWLMKMSHVIRAEDHLSNTLRQLMIYEAFEVTPPEFVHLSLLIGKDRQKLSKRHGATSVSQYQEDDYLPEALANYLCLLGWSHPEELDVFKLEELKDVFTLDRFSKSSALYDMTKLKYINGQHLRKLPNEELVKKAQEVLTKDNLFQTQTPEWKTECVNLLKDQIEFIKDFGPLMELFFNSQCIEDDTFNEFSQMDSTKQIKAYLLEQLSTFEGEFIDKEMFKSWQTHLKKEMKIKGKPLFMGLRVSLTGRSQGPELLEVVPLTPVTVLKERLQ